MKLNLDSYCIYENDTIKNAMKKIDKNLIGAALVLDDEKKVIGIVTDGDIRRAILSDKVLENKIIDIYNKNFKYVTENQSKKKAKEFMISNKIRQLPVLDENYKLKDMYFLDDLACCENKDNYVFILAGGLGTRLRPLTETVPKPMLLVGDKPILEVIIEQFKNYGFNNFIISLNYMGEIIENHFKDGKHMGVNIKYVKETKKLGTAGSIRLASKIFKKPFIVINGDILTGMDFDAFLMYHKTGSFDITVGVRNYEINVPYGVINAENNIIKSLKEKPSFSYFINSGVYVVNPNLIKLIPDGKIYNMTDLINDSLKCNHKSGVYNISEYWVDIGQHEEYKKANEDFNKVF